MLAGVPLVGITSTFQPRTAAAFLIAAAIVSQTATPQCTKLTVLPAGMGLLNAGRPIEAGRVSATLSSATAACTPAEVEPLAAAVLPALALLPAVPVPALVLQAAITTPSAAVSTAPATRLWRRGSRLRTTRMFLSLVCAAPARFGGVGPDVNVFS